MNYITKRSLSGLLAASIVGFSGCGGSTPEELQTTGYLSLGVSDGPIHNADAVCISFDEVELHSSGNSTIISVDEKVDLLNFQGTDVAPLVQTAEVEAGNYQWLRLGIDADQIGAGGADCLGDGSYIVINGESYNLRIPSGAETGLKLVGGITIPVGGAVDFTAEFDLARSITAPPGASPDIMMRPVIRLVNNVEVGTLTGMVHDDLATAIDLETEIACDPSVYVFNDGVTPNAIEDEVEDVDDPIATAMVSHQENGDGSMTWNYTIGFLQAPADYEAAFTCDGLEFEPIDGKPAPIAVGETMVVDFEVPTS